jgi:hypothetical protein
LSAVAQRFIQPRMRRVPGHMVLLAAAAQGANQVDRARAKGDQKNV